MDGLPFPVLLGQDTIQVMVVATVDDASEDEGSPWGRTPGSFISFPWAIDLQFLQDQRDDPSMDRL